jgi:hypothetical protein
MRWRKILPEEVISIVQDPDSIESTIGGRLNAFKTVSGRLIKVTYREFEDHLLIITAVIKSGEKR